MRKLISEKIARIDTLYPQERLAASKERWRRLWSGEPPLDRLPFMAGCAPGHPCYAASMESETILQHTLDALLLHGEVEDDFIPSLPTGCRQGTLPSMFGAKEVVVDGDYSCERMLQEASDVRTLPPPTVSPGTPVQGWLDMQQFFLDETEGRIPIHVADMQGPFDAAGKLLGYENLILSSYEDPDSYHALMTKTAEAFIIFWEAQASLLGDLFVGTHLWAWSWLPPGNGATVSVDSLVMYSPDFYELSIQPFLEVIAQRFGGVVTHSCGNFAGVVPSLCRTPGLRGINASQMSLRQLLDAGLTPDKVAVIVSDFQAVDDTAVLIAERRQPVELTVNSGIWPDDTPENWSAAQWSEIRRKTDHIASALRRAAESFTPL